MFASDPRKDRDVNICTPCVCVVHALFLEGVLPRQFDFPKRHI